MGSTCGSDSDGLNLDLDSRIVLEIFLAQYPLADPWRRVTAPSATACFAFFKSQKNCMSIVLGPRGLTCQTH